jgi:predicted MPP superfamily phosphohydrolase
MLSVHACIYVMTAWAFPGWLKALWLSAGASALCASASAPLVGPPRNGTGRVSLRSVLQRAGAVWNFVVLFSAAYEILLLAISHIHAMPPRALFPAALCLALLTCLYGLFEAWNVRSVFFSLQTRKLGPGERLRVVQISDLHIGPFMNAGHVARVARAALAAAPDLVVITGDTVDGVVGDGSDTLPFYRPFVRELRAIRESGPRMGVWAVPGNHEYYESFKESARFIESAGICLLRGSKADLGAVLLIGADDMDHATPSDADRSLSRSEALINSLSADEEKKFVLLLRHRPVVEKSTLGKFDLQLSGHTHGGQLVSLPSSRHRIPGWPKGILRLPCGSNIYVSNGAGFVGPPMRFFAPAEIVVIDLTGK